MNQTARGGLNHYRRVGTQASVETASPHRLTQMMMEAVVSRLSSATEAITNQDVAARGEAIGLAISIIAALQNSLDHEQGGEIADNLDRLYDYMLRQLVQANVDNDRGIIAEVRGLMAEVKSGWDAIPQALDQRAAS